MGKARSKADLVVEHFQTAPVAEVAPLLAIVQGIMKRREGATAAPRKTKKRVEQEVGEQQS